MRPQVISVPYRYDQLEEGLGLGPGRLLAHGLAERAEAVHVAHLDESEREPDRTAVNIGKLGRSTASLVASARSTGRPVIVLSGDDTASVGVVSGLQKADGAGRALGIVWIDAHGDFNTPDTSYSGILAGMPLAVIAGLAGPRWRDAADLGIAIPGERMLLLGAREIDDAENSLMSTHQIDRLSTKAIKSGTDLESAIERMSNRCELLYINIDLDVLDPHLVPSTTTPSANGLELTELADVLVRLLETGLVAAISLTSLNPLGGARGNTSLKTAWSVVETILENWKRVPSPPS